MQIVNRRILSQYRDHLNANLQAQIVIDCIGPLADPGILEPGGAVQARDNFLGLEIVLMHLYTYPIIF